jgi:tetratricopeptide (TPR) repeat protein
LVLFFGSINLFAQTADQHIYDGNKLYGQGKFKEAAAEYEKAYQEKKNREAQYNLGNSLYQQKDFEKAAKQYTESASNTKNNSLKAASYHNLGNTFLEQKKYDEAIQNFKQALKVNPLAKETKYNLAYAQAMKKKQDQQQKENKDKKDNNKDQQDKNKDQQQKDKKEKEEQDKTQQDKKSQDEKNKQDEQNKNQDGKEKEKPNPMPSKLTKEQADQLLNALNQEEKKLRAKKEKGSGQPMRLEKDW